MNIIYIKDALSLLKSGYVLESYDNENRLIFVYENTKIYIYSAKYTLNLDINDFIELYKDYKFTPIKNNDGESIDLKKDEEYYSSLQKHQ